MEEDRAGEDGVAAAAEPSPNRARRRRGESFSFTMADAPSARLSSSFAAGGICLGRGALAGTGAARTGSTIDVIGLIGVGVDVGVLATVVLIRTALPLVGSSGLARVGVGTGAPALPALAASAHMEATAVTCPPRPPRADLTPYFTST
jgi:hypothetical protein